MIMTSLTRDHFRYKQKGRRREKSVILRTSRVFIITTMGISDMFHDFFFGPAKPPAPNEDTNP